MDTQGLLLDCVPATTTGLLQSLTFSSRLHMLMVFHPGSAETMELKTLQLLHGWRKIVAVSVDHTFGEGAVFTQLSPLHSLLNGNFI